jgi:hypothetical protein
MEKFKNDATNYLSKIDILKLTIWATSMEKRD